MQSLIPEGAIAQGWEEWYGATRRVQPKIQSPTLGKRRFASVLLDWVDLDGQIRQEVLHHYPLPSISDQLISSLPSKVRRRAGWHWCDCVVMRSGRLIRPDAQGVH